MDILDFKDLEDWRLKNECYPFEDSLGNLCISVESEYESFGGEKDARLLEAKQYGIDRLIRFYGKTTPVAPKLYDAASTPDYFISSRVCVRMKVLVKIPKSTFDENTIDDDTCDINKPAEGYLSAFISVENYERDIDYVTTSMEDFLPKMAKSDKYMTNINIVKEIKRLKQVKNVIRRYFNLNSVTAAAIKEEECEPDVESLMEIGFDYNYSPVFALIDGSKYTIGYECFLESSLLNHPTTANYLIQIRNMSNALTKQLSLDFDIFQFLTQHTYPTPVLEAKKNTLDGLEKYDANGNLFSFANLAKLITLDLDKKSCKDDETVSEENDIIFNKQTSREIANAASQTKQFIGDMRLSTEGLKDLKETGRSMLSTVSDKHEAEKALRKVINDVVVQVNWGCVLEESLQCMLEEAITKFGTSVFDDPDLGQFFSADGAVEMFGLCNPSADSCENELQLKVGLPVFQGIKIPSNFPTTDYLAKTMDLALKQLYNILTNALVSLFLSLIEMMCKMVSSLPDFRAIESMIGEGFTSWLSETIGIDVSKLSDGQAWQDAATSAGGAGFMGVVGNFVSKTAGSRDSSGNWVWGGSATAVYSGTGVSLNLPNPNTGQVEEIFVSPELIARTISGFRKGTEDLEVVLTPEELRSLYKGAAPADVLDLAYKCLHMRDPELFQSPEDVSDLFSSLGKMVKGNFLENPAMSTPIVTNVCDIGDGSNQDVLRKNFLTSKDPLLSDIEIDELLSREKIRFIEKVKKAHKLLKSFQDGSIFPDFPSLFGSDDSLIQEAPPVISAAMSAVSEGLYSSTINNFNVSMLEYAPLWKEKYALGAQTESFAEHSKNLMIYDESNSLMRNVHVDDSVTNLGYTLSEAATPPEDSIISGEATEEQIGIYDWGNDFDAGKYTTEKLNWSGGSDGKFGELLEDAGIWNPTFSFIKEFIDWLIAPYVDIADYNWRDWIVLILALILASLVVVGTVALLALVGLGTAGTGWALVGTLVLSLSALIVLPPTMFMIVDWIIPELEGKVENEVTREELECLHDKGNISDEQWNDIEPVIDEVVDTMNKLAIANQNILISEIADYIQDEASQSNGSHTYSKDITNMLEDSIKETLSPGTMVELVLKTESSGIGYGEGKNSFITKTYIKKTPATSVEVTLIRPPGFSEVITSFERRGVRGDVQSLSTSDELDDLSVISSNMTLVNLYDSGIDLIEYDRVESKISNYYMEHQSSLLLGRKIPRSNMLEVRYSSTIDAPDNTAMELFQSQVEGGSDLQEYHKRLLEIMEQTDGYDTGRHGGDKITKDNVVGMHEAIWQSCMRAMAERVFNNRMYKDEYLNGLELEYPKQDIIGYKKITEASVDLTNSIMKLESSNSDYCDTLTPLRRSGSITGLRLMIRTFIVERVLNSIQVFDTFNVGFMTSDMFKKAVFDDIKVEMNKYYQSFTNTLKGKILSDMKETASKHFEIQELLGNEVPELGSDKEAILEIIRMEIDDINMTIAPEIGLDKFYHASSWDDFVFDTLLTEGEYSSPGGSEFVDEYVNFGSILDPYFKANTKYTDNNDGTFTQVASILYNGFIVIRAECDASAPEETTDDCEPIVDYSKVKTLLFNNEIYQDLISYVFPLKDAATLLSTYHLSAITDPAIFSATVNGKHVTDLFAETKLSTLQTFLTCIHGAGETSYIDPFLEKLKT